MRNPVFSKMPKAKPRRMDYVLAAALFVFVFIYAVNGKWPLQGLFDHPQPVSQPTAPPAPAFHEEPAPVVTRHYSGSVPRTCAEARARGIAPIYSHEPEYGAHLDADGDGIACEPYRGR